MSKLTSEPQFKIGDLVVLRERARNTDSIWARGNYSERPYYGSIGKIMEKHEGDGLLCYSVYFSGFPEIILNWAWLDPLNPPLSRGNSCARCDGLTAIDDYLCRSCRGY